MAQPVEALVARLGFPADPPDPRFREALTHSSAQAGPDYERLEYLGDAVLKLVVSRWLYDRDPALDEGAMTKVRARAVSDETLARAAVAMGLGPHLILGPSRQQGGRDTPSILASSFEAVIGVVYLLGGEAASTAFLDRWLGPEVARSLEVGDAENAKTHLQEYTQRRWKDLPEYRPVDTGEPVHASRWVTEVYVRGEALGRGEGTSKKAAEQQAAAQALASLRARGEIGG